MATEHKCPECGAPIEDVRVTCKKCGYGYQPGDYNDPHAGHEFTAGTMVDESGEEILEGSPSENP